MSNDHVHPTLAPILDAMCPPDRRKAENAEHRALVSAVLRGEDRSFWYWAGAPAPDTGDYYDDEAGLGISIAVWRACQMPGATPAERWQYLERAIATEATEYAEWKLSNDLTR